MSVRLPGKTYIFILKEKNVKDQDSEEVFAVANVHVGVVVL